MTSPYSCYWGKSGISEPSRSGFHLLCYHSLDVARVGRAYLERSTCLLHFFAARLGLPEDTTLNWITFWLALHDLGKFATSFQNQRCELLWSLQKRKSQNAYNVRHDSLGTALWVKLLRDYDVLGLGGVCGQIYAGRLQPWITAVTGHHGQPPRLGFALTEHAEVCDEEAAAAFVRDVRALLLPQDHLNEVLALPAERLGDWRLSWWLAGLTVLADWMGSNTGFFPYRADDLALGEYWEQIQSQAKKALADCGVLPPIAASPQGVAQLFGWDSSGSRRDPTPLQRWAEKVELSQGPQLFLLEDVTGAGKTEAAIELTHRLISAGKADGLFFGLPTMATANAMYGRIAPVTGKLFDTRSPPSVVLAHAQRKLHRSFRESVLSPQPVEVNAAKAVDETASARCAAWLADSNKKALLANVGVGTLDQALLGVLHAKHQSLRLLGLFRKVLIVDEVHACDAYMQKLLEGLLRFHAAAGGSAILLTATLPRRMKQGLVKAFAEGRGLAMPSLTSDAYPLATHVGDEAAEQALNTRPEVQRRVASDYEQDLDTVHARIQAALESGRCVCWIRNTIADALAAYKTLAPKLPSGTTTLFHARYAMGDRLDIENAVYASFGPYSGSEQRAGRLVIATQVVEQSLDLDFDLMISDLAPIDRLIQRAGRLHRHPRNAQGNHTEGADQRGEPKLIVFGPPWSESPDAAWYKKVFPGGACVYDHPGQLWLTARWLVNRGGFRMPEDGRAMVEEVFGERSQNAIPEALHKESDTSEGKSWAAANIAFANALDLATGYRAVGHSEWAADIEATPVSALDDWGGEAAATRLSEPTVTVRLARWNDGELVPWRHAASLSEAWESSSLRLPARLLGEPVRSAEDTTAFERAKEFIPDRGRWSVILPLKELQDGVAQGFADTPDGKRHCWRYDVRHGLHRVINDALTS